MATNEIRPPCDCLVLAGRIANWKQALFHLQPDTLLRYLVMSLAMDDSAKKRDEITQQIDIDTRKEDWNALLTVDMQYMSLQQ